MMGEAWNYNDGHAICLNCGFQIDFVGDFPGTFAHTCDPALYPPIDVQGNSLIKAHVEAAMLAQGIDPKTIKKKPCNCGNGQGSAQSVQDRLKKIK